MIQKTENTTDLAIPSALAAQLQAATLHQLTAYYVAYLQPALRSECCHWNA